ncbi:collagen alpha-1(XXI) chain-like, partial [Mytilus californianus]|uniref:collagen alpha-1(XXI) chain-like n=1 Tax=Mytilus californianus TaxID=6549 RepID=UPI0022455AA7
IMKMLVAHLICTLLVVKPSLQLFETKADVLFILDMSGSVGSANFTIMKNTAANIAGQFKIGKTDTQVGVDVFSTNVKTEIKLRSLNLIELLRQFIKQIPYVGGGTKTYDALDHARTSSFTKQNGDRPGIQNFAIVMTDGGSDDTRRTCAAAKKLREEGEGVIIFSIPIGDNIDQREIECIEDNETVRFPAPSFNALKSPSFRERIAKMILTVSSPGQG